MALHARLVDRCGIDVYVADARSPWQHPTNENGNGLIRRYADKGTDFSAFSVTDLGHIENRVNSLPRQVLGWDTAKNLSDQVVDDHHLNSRPPRNLPP